LIQSRVSATDTGTPLPATTAAAAAAEPCYITADVGITQRLIHNVGGRPMALTELVVQKVSGNYELGL